MAKLPWGTLGIVDAPSYMVALWQCQPYGVLECLILELRIARLLYLPLYAIDAPFHQCTQSAALLPDGAARQCLLRNDLSDSSTYAFNSMPKSG